MNCERFEERLDDFLDGCLSDIERRAAEEHRVACPRCAALVQVLRESLPGLAGGDPTATAATADLAAVIVERTSGSACTRAQGLLLAWVDGALGVDDSSLVEAHVAHCNRCTAMHGALVWLGRTLPELREADPGPDFTRAVVAATSARAAVGPPRPTWTQSVVSWWQRMVTRPRFAWEAAYVGLLLLVALFGTSYSPFRGVPQRALAAVQLDPRTAVRDAYDGLGAIGQHGWNATAGRIGSGAAEHASAVADAHPGMHEAYASFRVHWGQLQQAAGDRNFASAGLVLDAIGGDVRALWRSWTTASKTDAPR